MNLRTLQSCFKRALLNGDCADLFAEIQADSETDKHARFDIYRNNVKGGCLKVLKQIYPVCMQVLGEDIFLRAAGGYILLHPSHASDLDAYGADFSDFMLLLCQQEVDLSRFPFLPDLARLEWALHRAYHSVRDSQFDYHALQAVNLKNYADIVFVLSASLTPIESSYTVAEIWGSNGHFNEPVEVQPEYLCVHRRQRSPIVTNIDEKQYRLLLAIQSRIVLASLAEQFADLDSMLMILVKRGWVCGFIKLNT